MRYDVAELPVLSSVIVPDVTALAVSFRLNSEGETTVLKRTASNALMRPDPAWAIVLSCEPPIVVGIVVDDVSRMALSTSGSIAPFCEMKRAATPEMNGVAIDVPEMTVYEPLATGQVDRMLPPGAAIDGLRKPSLVRPYVVKSETRPAVSLFAKLK